MSEILGLASPCIKICLLDAAGETCLGCGRSSDEIGDWIFLSDAEREAIMERLAARAAEAAAGDQ
jgi:predicted Fe-S protein YdhL (DUF1289 family)